MLSKNSELVEDIILEEPRIEDLFRLVRITMTMVGELSTDLQEYFPKSLRIIGYLLTYLLNVFAIVLPAHVAVLHVVTLINGYKLGDLQVMSSAFIMVIIYSFCAIYTFHWMTKSSKLKNFFNFFNKNYRHQSFEGITFVNTHRCAIIAGKVIKYWLAACLSAVLLWGSIPIVTSQHTLPLDCWYPFDPLGAGVYEYIYFIQMLAQIQVGIVYANVSVLYVSLIMLIAGQYDVLFCCLKNFTYHAQIMSGLVIEDIRQIQDSIDLDEEEVGQYLLCEERKSNLRKISLNLNRRQQNERNLHVIFTSALNRSLAECVDQHTFILEAFAKMEDLYTLFCALKNFQVLFQMCFLAFVFVTVMGSAFSFMTLLREMSENKLN